MGVFNKRLYCDRACMAKGMIKPDDEVVKSTLHWRARRVLTPEKCSKCGVVLDLHVHHRDENLKNNDRRNLAALCSSCHLKHHWNDPAWRAKHATVRGTAKIKLPRPQDPRTGRFV